MSFAAPGCDEPDEPNLIGVPPAGQGGTGGTRHTRDVITPDAPLGASFDAGPRGGAGGRADGSVMTGGQGGTAGQGSGGSAGQADAAPPPADAMPVCDLLAQDCPQGQGCYPVQGGGVACRPAPNVSAAQCVESPECLPGRVCGVETQAQLPQCLLICEPVRKPCPGADACTPIVGLEPFGYCDPN